MREAWILDVAPVAEGMCVWTLDESGRALACVDPWHPSFYVKSTLGSEGRLADFFDQFRTPMDLQMVERKDFFSGRYEPVIKVSVHNPLLFASIVQPLSRLPDVALYNADMPLTQCYFYERGTFPLARCRFDIGTGGVASEIKLEDSPWELDYDVPPLRYAHLTMESPTGDDVWVNAKHRRGQRFVLTLGKNREDGVSYAMDASEDDLIDSLNRHIRQWDPDVLLTDGGDSTLIPRLQLHERRTGKRLFLSRGEAPVKSGAERSFFSYGKIHYRAGARTLFGRLHLDTRNSFMIDHTGCDGLFEIARVAKIPVQRAARCSIGTSLSSMQHEWAMKHDCLVPLDKGQTEDFRPALDLIAADRGGLVYEPELGWHEDLIEFDFASMYPQIMVRHNVTPEAVNCMCCPDNKVPGIEHHLCRKRGMVPDVLQPIVEKRAAYKKLIKQGHRKSISFKSRYDAFKWALVTCFGYLGYRNARFGKIEAHECVNAYGREALLRAKEVAEAEGFHFVHAIIDSLWLKKPGVSDNEVERLKVKIEEATGLPVGLEGRYRWIRFCPSKQNPAIGVPNRYLGVFQSGECKVRGIELRRHDTPLFLRSLQQELLAAMGESRDLNELHALQPRLERIVEGYRDRLRTGQVTPAELAIHKQLSQRPEEYRHDTLTALAAKKMAAAGVPLQAGETISYIVCEERDVVKDWRVMPLAFIEDAFEYDRRYYERLLDQALDILPFHPVTSSPVRKKPVQLELFL